MTDILGTLAYLVLPLAGIAVWRLNDVRRLALDGRIAIAGAVGALLIPAVMGVLSLSGIRWSRTILFPIAAIGLVLWRGALRAPRPRVSRASMVPLAIAVLLLLVTFYGAITARETSGDLPFFWGPKGVFFAQSRGIDADFLRDPNHFLQHRDYPPLLPLLFAWSAIVSGGFSWWAAVLSSVLGLAAIVAIVRSTTRDALGTLLLTSVLMWCMAGTQIAGSAEIPLLLFETLAVSALTLFRDARTQTILAAIGVAGAVVTKVEGAAFALAVLVAMIVDRRPLRRVLAVATPAAVLLGGWLAFIARNDLLDTYAGPGGPTFRYLGEVMKGTIDAAAYNALWVPWIAPLVVIFLGSGRRARLPLTIAALSIGSTLFYYLNSPTDPSVFWIPSSAQRVLLTPLLMLLIGAAAAHAEMPEAVPAPREAERNADRVQGQVANADVSLIALKDPP